jgi:hypothetical protein
LCVKVGRDYDSLRFEIMLRLQSEPATAIRMYGQGQENEEAVGDHVSDYRENDGKQRPRERTQRPYDADN